MLYAAVGLLILGSLAFCLGKRDVFPNFLRQPLLLRHAQAPTPSNEPPPPSVLLLGPLGVGKSTLFRRGLALSGEHLPMDEPPPPPTRGLVRRVLELPYSTGAARVLLCDAGGRREDRRHWVELVRLPGPPVGALVFVADAQDDTEETRDLFRQLSGAKWARRATLLVALTRYDVALGALGADGASELVERRTAEFRGVCARPFAVHQLCCHDAAAAERLLIAAVGGATEARPELMGSGQSREHVEELLVPDAAEPRVVLL